MDPNFTLEMNAEAGELYGRLLDHLVSVEQLQKNLNSATSRQTILELCRHHLERIFSWQTLGFFSQLPESPEFIPDPATPPEAAAALQAVVDQAVEEGHFAWAIKHHRPACMEMPESALVSVFCSLRTPRHLLGMMVGTIEKKPSLGWDIGLAQISTILGCAADALDNLELVQQLREANARLSAEVREKEWFLQVAAHDLRNPLLSISLNAELLPLVSDKPDALAKRLAIMEADCARMDNIIRSYLAVHNAEEKDLKPKKISLDFTEVCRTVTSRYAEKALSKNQHLNFISETALTAVNDSSILDQVLDNIVSNAIKFTPLHGTITVEAGTTGPKVYCSIHDSGPGIPEQDRPKLFTKFARLSTRPTGGEHSTGLGLAIARNLIEKLGGTLTFAPASPSGSIFRLEIPADQNPPV